MHWIITVMFFEVSQIFGTPEIPKKEFLIFVSFVLLKIIALYNVYVCACLFKPLSVFLSSPRKNSFKHAVVRKRNFFSPFLCQITSSQMKLILSFCPILWAWFYWITLTEVKRCVFLSSEHFLWEPLQQQGITEVNSERNYPSFQQWENFMATVNS